MSPPNFESSADPRPPAEARRDRLRAIGLMCAAVSLFAVLDTIGKYLVTVGELPVTQVVAMRFATNVAFALVLLPLVLGWRAMRRVIAARRPGLQLLRSLFMFGATIFNFWALRYLQLDQTITIFYSTPFLVALFAGPLLGEWVGWRRMLAIITGFLGVVLVTRPGFGGIHWAVVLSIGAACSYSLYNIATRYLARYDATEVTLFYSPVVGFLLSLPYLLFDWHPPQSLLIWGLLFVTGFLGGFGHWLLILAHRHAPAPVLAPFIYTNLLTIIALGYLVFGDVPSAWTLAGGMVVISSGLYIFYRERSTGRRAAVPPAA